MPVPDMVPLKDPKDYTLIGTNIPKKVDSFAKSHGQATYTIDIFKPDMLTAVSPGRRGSAAR